MWQTHILTTVDIDKNAIYVPDTPVTLKNFKVIKPRTNENPEQGYTHAKIESSCFNGVQEKVNVKGFVLFFSNGKYVTYLS